jgi:hypothetical protein
VQAIDCAAALVDQRFAIARQVPQLADPRRRHEAALQQPARQQLRDPNSVDRVGLATRDDQEYRLHELRSSLPGEVTVTAAQHPLCGERLVVEGRRPVGAAPCLIVRLPDGTPGTIEVRAMSAGAAAGEAAAGALLSIEGVCQLRRLLAPGVSGGDGSGT